jgi:hypothetical protein
VLEAWLREPMRAHLEAGGSEVRFEVPLNGRLADVVAHRGDELVAVELKLEDWREALAQAMHYQLAAHRAYIAMPLNEAILPLRQRSRLERQGVGLLAVHPLGEVRTLVEARESARRLPFLTQHTVAAWFHSAHGAAGAAGPAGGTVAVAGAGALGSPAALGGTAVAPPAREAAQVPAG